MKKICLTKNPALANRMFSSETASERNSESLLLFLFHGTEFRVRNGFKCWLLFLFHGTEFQVVFSSTVWFRTEFREFASFFLSERNSVSFLFPGTAGIPPEQTNCSVYSVFRGIILLSEIANPTYRVGGTAWTGSAIINYSTNHNCRASLSSSLPWPGPVLG